VMVFKSLVEEGKKVVKKIFLLNRFYLWLIGGTHEIVSFG
jgi:hypothetical protein